MENTIGDIIDDLINILSDAMVVIGEQSGPLQGEERMHVAAALAEAEARIDQILDPNVLPNLKPADAGSVDPEVNPQTLGDYAAECVLLAQEAWDEVEGNNNFDDTLVGTKLKTIKHLLTRSSPHNYRTKAGI